MRTTITARDCAAALDRLALKLDQAHAVVEALPPLDPAAGVVVVRPRPFWFPLWPFHAGPCFPIATLSQP